MSVLNSQDYIQSISKYLSRLTEYTKILNANGDFSINHYAESALLKMFNLFFNCEFSNANHSERQNYPAIDLIDKKKKIAIQVTSLGNLKKVKEAISRYFDNSVYLDVDQLYIFVLTDRQGKYNDESITKHIVANSNGVKLTFNERTHILDRATFIRELQKANDVKLLASINESLTEEFEKLQKKENLSSYERELKSKFSEIVLNDPHGMILKDVYVEPCFHVHENSLTDFKKRRQNSSDPFEFSTSSSIHTWVNEVFINERSDLHKELLKNRMLLLLGYPGQGKTSFCKKLLFDYITNKTDLSQSIFYFRLKDIRHAKRLIEDPIDILHEEACYLTEQSLDKFEFRKAILVLDGLDELYMKEDLRLEEIERICRELSKDVEKHQKLKIVLTSRYSYVDLDKIKHAQISIFQLKLFDIKHQIDWLERYIRFHPETKLTSKKLLSYHRRSQEPAHYISELLEQPLLLHIVASLKKLDDDSNLSRAKIYDQLFSELIERRYSEDGQLEVMQEVTKDDLRELIQEIAFGIFINGEGYISRKELLTLDAVQEYLSKFPNPDFKNSLKGIMMSFYFHESSKKSNEDNENDYVIEFLHKSLQEFMVAEKIARTIEFEFTNKDSKNRYIIGTFQDALQILNELFAKRPLTYEIHGYLKEMVQKIHANKKEEIADRLSFFMKDFFDNDFLLEYDGNFSSDPIISCYSTFTGCWLVAKNLSDRNYLHPAFDQKFCNYLMYLSNTADVPSYDDLNYQVMTFVDTRSHFRFGGDYIEQFHTKECEFLHIHMYEVIMKSCYFKDSEFYNLHVNGAQIVDTKFYTCSIEDSAFAEIFFNNTYFSGSIFVGVTCSEISFVNMSGEHFKHCDFDLSSFINLIREGAPIDIDLIERVEKDHYREGESTLYSKEELIDILEKNGIKYPVPSTIRVKGSASKRRKVAQGNNGD